MCNGLRADPYLAKDKFCSGAFYKSTLFKQEENRRGAICRTQVRTFYPPLPFGDPDFRPDFHKRKIKGLEYRYCSS